MIKVMIAAAIGLIVLDVTVWNVAHHYHVSHGVRLVQADILSNLTVAGTNLAICLLAYLGMIIWMCIR